MTKLKAIFSLFLTLATVFSSCSDFLDRIIQEKALYAKEDLTYQLDREKLRRSQELLKKHLVDTIQIINSSSDPQNPIILTTRGGLLGFPGRKNSAFKKYLRSNAQAIKTLWELGDNTIITEKINDYEVKCWDTNGDEIQPRLQKSKI